MFGILVANMLAFGGIESSLGSVIDPVDRAVLMFTQFFVRAKFYSLFSFLFGWGMAIQMARMEERGGRFVRVYLRRLLILLLFGVLHGVLLWSGDILTLYAILGFLLLALRKRSDKFILLAVLILLLLSVGLVAPGDIPLTIRTWYSAGTDFLRFGDYPSSLYATGSYAEITRLRLSEYLGGLSNILYYFGNVFAMFMLGFYVGRRGIFRNLEVHRSWLRSTLWAGMILGLGLNSLFLWSNIHPNFVPERYYSLVYVGSRTFGAPALMLFYVATIILLAQKEVWRSRLMPLANVGRMALSNYLLQTVLATLIFYQYGLGLYGEASPGFGLALTILIFVFQIRLSDWWLQRYRFGPMEWVWRSLTYGRLQAMSRYSTSIEMTLPLPLRELKTWIGSIPAYVRLGAIWLVLILWGFGLLSWYGSLRSQIGELPEVTQASVTSTQEATTTKLQPTSVVEQGGKSSGQLALLYTDVYRPKAVAASGDPIALADQFDIESAIKYDRTLTGPPYLGRAAGSPAGHAAGDYLADQFEKLGLAPAGDNDTYFQEFTVNYTPLVEAPILRIEDHQGAVWDDYQPFHEFSAIISQYIGSGEGKGMIFWLGSCSEQDFRKTDLVGKVGLCRSDDGSISLETAGRMALERGAVGLLVLVDSAQRPMDFSIPYHETWVPRMLPGLWVPPTVVEDILKGSGESLSELMDSEPHELHAEAYLKVQAAIGQVCPGPACQARNVLGLLPGRDPQYSQEVVIIGAHYDHMGQGPEGTVWAGANDDASGVAALLEIARSWKSQGFVPRRSVLFAAWDGEEQGLLGSHHYVDNPTLPLESTLAMLQLDMVGDGAETLLISKADNISSNLMGAAEYLGVPAEISDVGGSDHVPFLKVGVPASLLIWQFPQGQESNYHQPSDILANLNPDKLEKAAKIAAITTLNIAEVEPAVQESLERRAVSIEKGDLSGFLTSSSPDQRELDSYWFNDLQTFNPVKVTMKASHMVVRGGQASSRVRFNMVYMETGSQIITQTLSTTFDVKFINHAGQWQWSGPDLVYDEGSQEEASIFTTAYPGDLEKEIEGLAGAAQQRYARIAELLDLPVEEGGQIMVFPDESSLRASTALSLPPEQEVWIKPEQARLVYREGITQSLQLDQALGQLLLANHGVIESASPWLWNGLTMVWHEKSDPVGFQEVNIPRLQEALNADKGESRDVLAWAATDYLVEKMGWKGLGKFISILGEQCILGRCLENVGLDNALQESIGMDSQVFERSWRDQWISQLSHVQELLDANLQARADAILSGDEHEFLGTINPANPGLHEAERHWFELAMAGQASVSDFSATPVLLKDDGSVVADVDLTYRLAGSSEPLGQSMRINFVPGGGQLLWSGVDFQVLSNDILEVHYTQPHAELASQILKSASPIYTGLAELLSVDKPRKLTIELYEDGSAYGSSIGLTFQAGEWIKAWTAPGEGIKLLVEDDPNSTLYRARLTSAMVRNLLLQRGIKEEWILKGGEVYWSHYFDGGKTSQSAASYLPTLVENVEAGFVYELGSMPLNLDLSREEFLFARTQAWDSLRFFAETYGSRSLEVVVNDLSTGDDLDQAIQRATGKSLAQYQEYWQGWLKNGYVDANWVDIARSFDQESALQYVDRLTEPRLKGRAAGTYGAESAAEYIAEKFSNYGLLPAGNISATTYTQSFPISTTNSSYPPGLELLDDKGASSVHLYHRDDFSSLTVITDSVGYVTGELAWVGGDPAPDEGLMGKILLINQVEDLSSVVQRAAKAGAIGVIIPGRKSEVEDVLSKRLGSGIASSIPVFELTQQGTHKLREEIEALQDGVPEEPGISFLGAVMRIGLGSSQTENVETSNVLGLLPGSDPSLRDEVLVLGAHYDYVGDDPDIRLCSAQMGCELIPGRKYSGANDDASGVGVLLAIARLWHENGYQPKRSVLFAAWGAQEYGQLGSSYFISSPTLPAKRMIGMLQLDGIGGGDGFNLGAQGLWESDGNLLFALENASSKLGEELVYTDKFEPSDHLSFQEVGVPNVLMAWRLARDANLPDGIASAVHSQRLGVTGRVVSLAAMTLAR